MAAIGSADSGLCARLTFAASASQNGPTDRNRISLERNNQPSTPSITAAFSLWAERDFAASSLRNFCWNSDTTPASPAALTLPNDINPERIVRTMPAFRDVIHGECVEYAKISALLKRSRPRRIATLQSVG